jgi:hypothetical protein
MVRLAVWVIAAVVATATGFSAQSADAASAGVGFGTWAPVSPYGWHGSMVIDGVHTYCILPGAPAPTGQSTDRGISGSAAGLSPAQLTGINLLVTRYGQTSDPIQAAAVAWAVKAIANWNEALHHFGYRGSSLAGAIHWTFSSLAPAQNEAVQHLAVAYYDEAMRTPATAPSVSGAIVLTTDANDPSRGTVQVDSAATGARGSIRLAGATFTDTGSSERSDAVPGVAYPIAAPPPSPGRAYSVTASARMTAGMAAAVRHYTTPGGQDTAGPAGELVLEASAVDAAPRAPRFAPTITTQVESREASVGGPYIDTVTFAGDVGDWPRDDHGGFLPVSARADVYRTAAAPTAGALPADATIVGGLSLVTDDAGPTREYRVRSEWTMREPGFYTAVWHLQRDGQQQEVAAHLSDGFAWSEEFGAPSQVTELRPPPAPEAAPEPLPTAPAQPPAGPAPAPPPAPVETAQAAPAEPAAALAATGQDSTTWRAIAGGAIALVTVGTTLFALPRRRRFGASLRIG